jgi:hypothetical protein
VTCLEQAIEIWENLRDSVPLDDALQRVWLLSNQLTSYRLLVSALVEMGNYNHAIEIVDLCKAKALVEWLSFQNQFSDGNKFHLLSSIFPSYNELNIFREREKDTISD